MQSKPESTIPVCRSPSASHDYSDKQSKTSSTLTKKEFRVQRLVRALLEVLTGRQIIKNHAESFLGFVSRCFMTLLTRFMPQPAIVLMFFCETPAIPS